MTQSVGGLQGSRADADAGGGGRDARVNAYSDGVRMGVGNGPAL